MRTKYTKRQAIQLFGSIDKMAAALNITRQAVSMMPAKLPQRKSDEVLGCAIRAGMIKVVEVSDV